MKRLSIALVVLVLTASVVPTAAVARTSAQSGQAYAGTHVSFETSAHAVTDYAVDDEAMVSSVKVQSESSAESSGFIGVDASLSAVTHVEGSALSVVAKTETEATVTAESGAEMTAHDNGNGILVVESGGESNYVVANLSSGASASAESDSQVQVTTESGTKGTFIVVGDGEVTVNEYGDVSAQLGADGRLVFRSYPDGKDDSDDKQEQLIAEGTAKAEAYVMAKGESTVVDTVSYGQKTTIEAKQTTQGEVEFAVERTASKGKVVITHVSEEVVDASSGVNVMVEGEAAAKASTYSQLKSAIGSDQSRYMVEGAGSATAKAQVLVAVNSFSTKSVTMESEDSSGNSSDGDGSDDSGSGDGSDSSDGSTSSGTIPGFTATAGIVALLGAALLARKQ